jgi:hypothetical protein
MSAVTRSGSIVPVVPAGGIPVVTRGKRARVIGWTVGEDGCVVSEAVVSGDGCVVPEEVVSGDVCVVPEAVVSGDDALES